VLIAKLKEVRAEFPDLFPQSAPKSDPKSGSKSYRGGNGSGASTFDPKNPFPEAKNPKIPRHGGGEIKPWHQYVTGEKGPELVTGVQGHVMPANSFQSSIAREVVQTLKVSGFASPVSYKGGGSVMVDQSTQIIGGQFTVQSQDPDEMGRRLKGKERLDRLRSPKPTPLSG
jgi:hypothetical protein